MRRSKRRGKRAKRLLTGKVPLPSDGPLSTQRASPAPPDPEASAKPLSSSTTTPSSSPEKTSSCLMKIPSNTREGGRADQPISSSSRPSQSVVQVKPNRIEERELTAASMTSPLHLLRANLAILGSAPCRSTSPTAARGGRSALESKGLGLRSAAWERRTMSIRFCRGVIL